MLQNIKQEHFVALVLQVAHGRDKRIMMAHILKEVGQDHNQGSRFSDSRPVYGGHRPTQTYDALQHASPHAPALVRALKIAAADDCRMSGQESGRWICSSNSTMPHASRCRCIIYISAEA
jgi:hypothetical protein